MICCHCKTEFVQAHRQQVWCGAACRKTFYNRRYYSKPGVKAVRNARKREKTRLAKLRRKEQGERRRATIAAMFKKFTPETV